MGRPRGQALIMNHPGLAHGPAGTNPASPLARPDIWLIQVVMLAISTFSWAWGAGHVGYDCRYPVQYSE
jgi:hypothetical protein